MKHWLTNLICCVLAGVVAAHAGLMLESAWQGDEYLNFAFFNDQGWHFVWLRILYWSPRIISEPILFLYAALVDRIGKPVIVVLLLPLWLILALVHMKGCTSRRCVLLGLAIFCLCLLGHPISEMFFWPMAAVPYLLALAAISFVVFEVISGSYTTSRGFIATAAALLVAAGCAEVGAIFASALGSCLLRREIIVARKSTALARSWVKIAALLLVIVAGVIPFVLLQTGRGIVPAEVRQQSPALHNWGISLGSALAEFGTELLTLDAGGTNAESVFVGVTIAVLLLMGFACLLWESPPPYAEFSLHACLILALLATNLLMMVAAYYQFGELCCERHFTFRECLLILTLLTGGSLVARCGRPLLPSSVAIVAGPACIAIAVALAFDGRGGELILSYRNYPQALAAARATWKSGTRPGINEMELFQPRADLLPSKFSLPPGRFESSQRPRWEVEGILRFFHKSTVIIFLPQG